MTTLPRITSLAGASGTLETLIRQLVEGHNAAAYVLPDDVARAIVAADTLTRFERDLGTDLADLVDRGGRARVETRTIALAVTNAASGAVSLDTFGPVVDVDARIARLRTILPTLTAAARQASSTGLDGVLSGSDRAIRDALADALTETLAAAAPHVPRVARVDLRDPAGLMKAPAAAQSAFRALEPLAARHDFIRRASVAWASVQGGEALAGAGSGVEDHRRLASGPHGGGSAWVFTATGHPVARLVEVVLADSSTADERAS